MIFSSTVHNEQAVIPLMLTLRSRSTSRAGFGSGAHGEEALG
jgi:hypothetical protein